MHESEHVRAGLAVVLILWSCFCDCPYDFVVAAPHGSVPAPRPAPVRPQPPFSLLLTLLQLMHEREHNHAGLTVILLWICRCHSYLHYVLNTPILNAFVV